MTQSLNDEDDMNVESKQLSYRILPPDSAAIDPEVFVAFTLDGAEVEEYRALRTQLSLRWFEGNRKSLLFTSTRDGQGASHTVANLAILFSQMGLKTILIDANLRNPVQHDLFRLDNSKGLADLLSSKSNENHIQKVRGFEYLHVLTAGSSLPNPLELLSIKNFWTAVEQAYDIVLIDSPPALEFSDAQLIASQVGGAVVVARVNDTKKSDLKKLEQQLEIAKAAKVGVVLKDF